MLASPLTIMHREASNCDKVRESLNTPIVARTKYSRCGSQSLEVKMSLYERVFYLESSRNAL